MKKQIASIKIEKSQDGSQLQVKLSGHWVLTATVEGKRIMPEFPADVKSVAVLDAGIESWDGFLLLEVDSWVEEAKKCGISSDISSMPSGLIKMLQMAEYTAQDKTVSERESFFYMVGNRVTKRYETVMKVMEFFGDWLMGLGRLFSARSRMRGCDFTEQLSIVGPYALGIVSLIGFLMGVILAFIGAIPLQWFKAEIYVASLVGIGMLRMLAPVMVAVVMAGRSAAAFAAELGTMRVNQEIDSFVVLGMPPIDFLIMPRFLAMVLMFPVLAAYADIISVLGGAMVGLVYLKISWMEFYQTLLSTVRFSDFYVGIFSSVVYGILVALCGCYHGINCGRNAASVGHSTTAAVVSSIVCIVISTAIITFLTVMFRI